MTRTEKQKIIAAIAAAGKTGAAPSLRNSIGTAPIAIGDGVIAGGGKTLHVEYRPSDGAWLDVEPRRLDGARLLKAWQAMPADHEPAIEAIDGGGIAVSAGKRRVLVEDRPYEAGVLPGEWSEDNPTGVMTGAIEDLLDAAVRLQPLMPSAANKPHLAGVHVGRRGSLPPALTATDGHGLLWWPVDWDEGELPDMIIPRETIDWLVGQRKLLAEADDFVLLWYRPERAVDPTVGQILIDGPDYRWRVSFEALDHQYVNYAEVMRRSTPRTAGVDLDDLADVLKAARSLLGKGAGIDFTFTPDAVTVTAESDGSRLEETWPAVAFDGEEPFTVRLAEHIAQHACRTFESGQVMFHVDPDISLVLVRKSDWGAELLLMGMQRA